MKKIENLKLLVLTQDDHDREYLQGFFEHIEGLPMPDFATNELKRVVDKYDLIVFSAYRLGAIQNEEQLNALAEEERRHLDRLEYYLKNSTKYIVYFGKYYYALNAERCMAANSKLTLFARIRELLDFLNHYRESD